MLLFEIVFWFNFRVSVFENIEKTGNNLLYFVLGELGANPDDEAGYFGHRGLASGIVFQLHLTLLRRGRQAYLTKTRSDFMEMTALWEVWKSLLLLSKRERFRRLSLTSHNALEKPTAFPHSHKVGGDF